MNPSDVCSWSTRIWHGVPVVVFSVLIVGCGDSRLVPVSGTVTLDGKPTADIIVHFQPSAGNVADLQFSPSSRGATDSKGRYELKTFDGAGAIVGEHVVTLVCRDPNNAEQDPFDDSGMEKPRQFKLPPKARDGSLTFTVPDGGTEEANFAFQSSPAQPATQAYRRH